MNVLNNRFLINTIAAAAVTIGGYEGLRLTSYTDLAGVPTACYGETGPHILLGQKYTKAQCDAFLETSVLKHAKGMLNCVNVPLTYGMFIAYSSFAYNVGVSAFCNSTLLRLLNEGLYKDACERLGQWSYVNGKYVQGLYNRRMHEYSFCIKPD